MKQQCFFVLIVVQISLLHVERAKYLFFSEYKSYKLNPNFFLYFFKYGHNKNLFGLQDSLVVSDYDYATDVDRLRIQILT